MPLPAEPSGPPGLPGRPTLDYSNAHYGRPGILTAVGVISIVLGSLGVLRSLWQMITYAGMLLIAQMSFPVVATTPGGGMTPAGTISATDAGVITAALVAAQTLSTADQARIASAIQSADIPLAPPPDGQPWTQEHVNAQINATSVVGPSVTYKLAGGTIQIDPGTINIVSTSASGTGMSTTTITTGGGMTSFGMANSPFSGISIALVASGMLVELFNLGLAALLLTAGIATMRGSVRSPRLHRWWAWLKFPAVALSTAVGIWMAFAFFESFGMTATQTPPGGGATVATPIFGSMGWLMVIPSIGAALLACIYPVAVLIVFSTRKARAYYGGGN